MSAGSAPTRDDAAAAVASSGAARRSPTPDLICVGGIPGAGKTTAIRAARRQLPELIAIDPEDVYRPLHAAIGAAVPYRAWRWLVHGVHTARLLGHLVMGPSSGRVLVVHEPSTRSRRRLRFVRAARRLGWQPALLYVDTGPELSRTGQVERGRVLPAASFDRHCARWARLAADLEDHPADLDRGSWSQVLLTDRAGAVAAIRRLCRGV
jgi:hypothetical protein